MAVNEFPDDDEHDQEDELQYGNADEEEYDQGEINGVAYIQKKTKKYSQGAAGLISKMEELRTEEVCPYLHSPVYFLIINTTLSIYRAPASIIR